MGSNGGFVSHESLCFVGLERRRTPCSGPFPTSNVPWKDERPYSCESTNKNIIVCSFAELMNSIDLINSDVVGY